MTTLRRRTLLNATAGAVALALPGLAWAQYPDRQVKLIVGFPPGTGPDVVARTLGQKLGDNLKQSLVVDNRAGAGGQIAAQAVANSPPDGYNLLLGEVGSIAIAPAAYAKLPYEPARELIGVSEVVRSDFVLVVPVNSPHRTVAEFVTAAKAGRDKVNLATFGAGTPGHFGAVMFAEMAGFRTEPIHYRATGDALTALVAGDVAGAFVSTALAVPQVKGGKMRALGTTAPQRSIQLPDVPTFTEAGYPRLDFSAWFAVFVPAGTPDRVVALLNQQVVAAVQAPDTKAKLQEAGFSVFGTSVADTGAMLDREAKRWAQVVKATGFKGD